MFKFNKDKDTIDIDINIDYDMLTKSAIPLLIQNKEWNKLFGDIEEKDIVELKNKLEKLSDENQNVKKELSMKKSEKKKLIAKVLTLSDEINNNNLSGGLELLESYQKQIHEINDDIDELTFKSETLPREVRSTNLELLKITIKYAYTDIYDSERNLRNLNSELDRLREKLRSLIKEKHDNEEKRNDTYTFLHSLLGREEIDRLDRDILD